MAKKKRVTKQKPASSPALPRGYKTVVTHITRLIAESRRRTLSTVNRELALLYWQIGSVIVRQQEEAKWGDGVVEQLAGDLRAEFPDMKGLSRANVFQMRQFILSCNEIDAWPALKGSAQAAGIEQVSPTDTKVATVSGLFEKFPGVASDRYNDVVT